MASSTDVVNIALRLIGANRITNITDGSNNANVAADIYEHIRDDLLRLHPWNFATKRQKLAQSAVAPEFEFDYAYPLPSDWLRTVSVTDNDAGYGTILYRSEVVNSQRCIITSSTEVYLRYIFRETDPTKWSADFRKAVAYAIARDMALPITSSNELQSGMANMAQRVLNRARSADSMGASPESRPRGSWATSRGGWRRRMHDAFSD